MKKSIKQLMKIELTDLRRIVENEWWSFIKRNYPKYRIYDLYGKIIPHKLYVNATKQYAIFGFSGTMTTYQPTGYEDPTSDFGPCWIGIELSKRDNHWHLSSEESFNENMTDYLNDRKANGKYNMVNWKRIAFETNDQIFLNEIENGNISGYTMKGINGNILESRTNNKKYTKKQITEAIAYWKKQLANINKPYVILERKMTRTELDDFYQKLETGTVKFSFKKKDGTMRDAVGTLDLSLMPSMQEQRRLYDEQQQADPSVYQETFDQMLQKFEQRKDYMIYFWDLEKNAYRQFHVSRFEGVNSFTPSDNKNRNVSRIDANTFVYSDTQSLDKFLTPTQVDSINDEIESVFPSGIPVAVGASSVKNSGKLEFQYNRGSGVPTLIYISSMELPPSNEPLKIAINDIIQLIAKKFNVKIAKVKVNIDITCK